MQNALESLSVSESSAVLPTLQKLTAEIVVVFSMDSAFDELHQQVAIAIRKNATVSIDAKCGALLGAIAEKESSTLTGMCHGNAMFVTGSRCS